MGRVAAVTAKWWTPGVPAPKGSARAIKVGRGDKSRAVLVASGSDANKAAQKSWSNAVGWSARAAWRGEPLIGPVGVALRFVFVRPPSAPRKQWAPEVKPDFDKITRCTVDALTGIVFVDDAQIVDAVVSKRYGDQPGCTVEVWPVTEEQER